MNKNLPDLVFNGILLGLCIQLIMIGLWHILRGKSPFIGLIGYIKGTGWIYSLYFPIFGHSLLSNIFMSGYKELAIFPLLYIFFKSKIQKQTTSSTYLRHLALPIFLTVSYLFFKFGFADFFKEHISRTVGSINFIGQVIFLTYFVLIFKLLNRYKQKLKSIAHKRYLSIFWILSCYSFLGIVSFYLNLIGLNPPEFYYQFNRYFWNPLRFLVYSSFLIFLIVEIDGLRTFILGSDILNQYNNIADEERIRFYDQQNLISKKLFLQKDFNISNSLKKSHISERQFRLYLKKEYQLTLNEYLNKLKIDEFIFISKMPDKNRYDLEALASEVGFSSSSTFYRVFKKIHGTTPSKYLKSS